MATSITRSSPKNPDRTLSIRRIRFVGEALPGDKVRRTFVQPRPVVAIEETGDADLSAARSFPEAIDRCDVVFIQGSSSADLPKNVQDWLAPPAAQTEAVAAVVLTGKQETVRWRPGQVVVQGRPDRLEWILAGVTDFAFFEGELRALEQIVEAHEGPARADTVLAHQIRRASGEAKARFARLIAYFSDLRLNYGRLEPHLVTPSRTLCPDARRLVGHLLRKACVEDRLEAVSNRLEALEDLYEGANDRVADYRWFRQGHWLEMGILLMLVIEAGLMIGDICIHYREYQAETHSAAIEEKSAATGLADEFEATLTKIEDGQLTFTRTEGIDEDKSETMPFAATVKVSKGRKDPKTKELEAGEEIPKGLQNELFTKRIDKGIGVTLITDASGKKVVEVIVMGHGKKR